MLELVSFFFILLAALTFSAVFGRLHLPWVLSLIVAGMIVGPFGTGVLQSGPVLEFMADIGLIFLMFLAGLETPLSAVKERGSRIGPLAFVNGFVPFLVGLGVAWSFGYGRTEMLFTGIVFISSSVALVIPTLESSGLIKKPLGVSILATTMLQDIGSLILLSILLQSVDPVTTVPLPIFYLVLAVIFFFGRWVLANIRSWMRRIVSAKVDRFEQELRSIIVILLGTIVVFEMLGLHSITAGFFAGLVLSESITEDAIRQKLHAISYGIFVPIFFISVGMGTDLSVLLDARGVALLTIAVITGSVLSKLLSGWVGALMSGYSSSQALLFGASSVPQLSTTLAVAYTGLKLGLVDQPLVTAFIMLSIVTTLVSPLLMNWFVARNANTLSLPFLGRSGAK